MGRPRKTNKQVHFGGLLEAGLVIAFGNLAKELGISQAEALRRVVIQAVMSREIPGVRALDYEDREREKWGRAAVPQSTNTYDGEEEIARKPAVGEQRPVSHPAE